MSGPRFANAQLIASRLKIADRIVHPSALKPRSRPTEQNQQPLKATDPRNSAANDRNEPRTLALRSSGRCLNDGHRRGPSHARPIVLLPSYRVRSHTAMSESAPTQTRRSASEGVNARSFTIAVHAGSASKALSNVCGPAVRRRGGRAPPVASKPPVGAAGQRLADGQLVMGVLQPAGPARQVGDREAGAVSPLLNATMRRCRLSPGRAMKRRMPPGSVDRSLPALPDSKIEEHDVVRHLGYELATFFKKGNCPYVYDALGLELLHRRAVA